MDANLAEFFNLYRLYKEQPQKRDMKTAQQIISDGLFPDKPYLMSALSMLTLFAQPPFHRELSHTEMIPKTLQLYIDLMKPNEYETASKCVNICSLWSAYLTSWLDDFGGNASHPAIVQISAPLLAGGAIDLVLLLIERWRLHNGTTHSGGVVLSCFNDLLESIAVLPPDIEQKISKNLDLIVGAMVHLTTKDAASAKITVRTYSWLRYLLDRESGGVPANEKPYVLRLGNAGIVQAWAKLLESYEPRSTNWVLTMSALSDMTPFLKDSFNLGVHLQAIRALQTKVKASDPVLSAVNLLRNMELETEDSEIIADYERIGVPKLFLELLFYEVQSSDPEEKEIFRWVINPILFRYFSTRWNNEWEVLQRDLKAPGTAAYSFGMIFQKCSDKFRDSLSDPSKYSNAVAACNLMSAMITHNISQGGEVITKDLVRLLLKTIRSSEDPSFPPKIAAQHLLLTLTREFMDKAVPIIKSVTEETEP